MFQGHIFNISLQQWELKPDGACVCAKESEISTQTATVEETRNTADALRADGSSELSPRQVSWASSTTPVVPSLLPLFAFHFCL